MIVIKKNILLGLKYYKYMLQYFQESTLGVRVSLFWELYVTLVSIRAANSQNSKRVCACLFSTNWSVRARPAISKKIDHYAL